MQNIYFLVSPHHLSADMLRHDLSFPSLHFCCIYYHVLVIHTRYHLQPEQKCCTSKIFPSCSDVVV